MFQIGRDSLWYDELYTVWASRLPLGQLLREVPASGHPPLYYLFLHAWLAVYSSDAWVRLLSLIVGVITVWLVYLVGRELFDRRVGLWGAAFAALSPYLTWYSRDATDYAWLVAMGTASLYFLVRSIRRGGRIDWFAYVFFTTAALYSHFNAVFLLPAGIFLFLFLSDYSRRQLKAWIIAEAFLMFLMLPWLIYNWTATSFMEFNPFYVSDIIDGMSTSIFIFVKGYAGTRGGGVGTVWLLGWQKWVMIIIYIAVILILLLRPLRTAFVSRKTMALVSYTMVLIAGPVALQGLRGLAVSGRFYALAAPTFILLGAVLISRPPPRPAIVAGGIILLGLAVFSTWGNLKIRNHDWRGVMTTIQANQQSGDAILCFPLHHCTVAEDYYLNSSQKMGGGYYIYNGSDIPLLLMAGPDQPWQGYLANLQAGDSATDNISPEQIAGWLKANFGDNDRIWLVAGDGALGQYPRAPLIQEALAQAGWQFTDEYDYSPLLLDLYQRRVNVPR
ncbi:MAG: glycosyltransferase family 39 protein [Thermoleophilia bacterium]